MPSKRLRREAEIGKRIRHPHVVATFGFESEVHAGTRCACVLMELVDGETLRERIDRSGPLSVEDCLRVGCELARGLEAVHAAGATHGDVKPSNIILDRNGRTRLMDLGIACGVADSNTGFAGTIAYAAPEQLRKNGVRDGRTDLYALGLTLHEIATGAHRFSENARTPPSRFLESVIRSLVTPRAADRIQTAGELAAILAGGPDSEAWRRHRRLRRTGLVIRSAAETEFLGRERERARLEDAFARLGEGRGSALLVAGGAGIGKSRLLAEFERRLRARGAAFDLLHASHSPDRMPWEPAGLAHAFAERFGVGATRVEPQQLTARLARLAQRLTKQRPLVICVEDLHFAPEPERQLFVALARMLAPDPVLLLGSMRPGVELPVERIELQPIPDDVMAAIAAADDPPGEVVARAAGNPHFLVESLRAWRETRSAAPPESVIDLLAARFDRLPAALRSFTEIAACCGFRFDPALVGRSAGWSALEGRRVADDLAARGFLRAAGTWCEWDHHRAFELMRTRVDDTARREHSGRIADAVAGNSLERRVQRCALLLDAGRPEEADTEFDAILPMLGEGSGGAPVAALLGRFVARNPPRERRIALLSRYARCLHDAGRHEEQKAALVEALDLVRETDEPALRAQLLGELAGCHGAMRNHAEAGRCAERALRDAEDPRTRAPLLRLIGRTTLVAGRGPQAQEFLRRALDAAREARDAGTEMQALSDLVQMDVCEGRFRSALAKYQHVAALARRIRPRPLPAMCFAIGHSGPVLPVHGREPEGDGSTSRGHFGSRSAPAYGSSSTRSTS